MERQVQTRWSSRKWFIGTEFWPAAMAPWAAILSDLLNRAGLGLFVTAAEDLRGEPACCKMRCRVFSGRCFPCRGMSPSCGLPPCCNGTAAGTREAQLSSGWKAGGINKTRREFSAVSEEVKEEPAIYFQGSLGS